MIFLKPTSIFKQHCWESRLIIVMQAMRFVSSAKGSWRASRLRSLQTLTALGSFQTSLIECGSIAVVGLRTLHLSACRETFIKNVCTLVAEQNHKWSWVRSAELSALVQCWQKLWSCLFTTVCIEEQLDHLGLPASLGWCCLSWLNLPEAAQWKFPC